jgi:hypothetical protein
MPSLLNNSGHWLQRAQETRRLAESISDAETKKTLLKIAEEYERLARRAATRGDGEGEGDSAEA